MPKLYLTKNACYIKNQKMKPTGFILHSTGAENQTLRRYLPNDGVIGENLYGNHWNQLKPDGMYKCVHGFIGEDKNGVVRYYQTLPYDVVGWHCGGNGNYMGYVGVEICEGSKTDKEYFNKAYNRAVKAVANFFIRYNLKVTKTTLISHKEANKMGIASNHGDPESYFVYFGKTMNDFRVDVQKEMIKITKEKILKK